MMFIENRIPFAPIMTGGELLELPHLMERGAIEQYELPDGGVVACPGQPVPGAVRRPLGRTTTR